MIYLLLLAVIVIVICYVSLQQLSPKIFQLQGSHVLITGGSSGIGLAIAKEAVKSGANVTILARNERQLIAAEEDLCTLIKNGCNQKVARFSVDVGGDYSPISDAVQQAEKSLGPVDVLINNAGISTSRMFEDIPLTEFERIMNVNYMGSVKVTKAVVEGMKERQKGRVVFVSSQAGQLGVYGFTAYSASKFALRGLAESLQMELKPYNIRVCLCCPPDTDTPGFAEECKHKPEETCLISQTSGLYQAEDVAKALVQDIIKGRFVSYVGLDGWMLATLTCGMSPATSACEAIVQVLCLSVFRAISLFYLVSFDRIILRCKQRRNAQKNKQQ